MPAGKQESWAAQFAGNSPVRAAVRFPLSLPVRLAAGAAAWHATTIDVSSTGILFAVGEPIPVGTELHWELYLPAAAMGTQADIQVVCSGRVVSVRAGEPFQVAVVLDDYRMRENTL